MNNTRYVWIYEETHQLLHETNMNAILEGHYQQNAAVSRPPIRNEAEKLG